MTTSYDLEPAKATSKDKLTRAERCAVKLGYFEADQVPAVKAHMDAHTVMWLPPYLKGSFIEYMSMLEGLLSPNVIKEKLVRKHFKLAKSALVNGKSFSPYAAATLHKIIKKVVTKEQERLGEAQAQAEA